MIIEPEPAAAPPAAESQSPCQSAEEVANSLLHLSRVSNNNVLTAATKQPVAMETEEDVTVAAEQGKDGADEMERDLVVGEGAHRAGVSEQSCVLQRDNTAEDGSDRNSTSYLSEDVHDENIRDEEEDMEMAAATQQTTAGEEVGDKENQEEVKHVLPISDVPSTICTITSSAAAQGIHTEAQDKRASPLEDYKSTRANLLENHTVNRASPLDKYDSLKSSPLQNYKTSPPLSYSSHGTSPIQDYLPIIRGENYKFNKTLASPDIIEVHSDKSEEKDFDDMDGDDEHDDEDSLSQRSTVTDESEMFDISRGNLGLLEQAIALKAEQVKPAGPRELLCAPDIHHQRYLTKDDRPKHLDVIRKSYLGKGRAERRAMHQEHTLASEISHSTPDCVSVLGNN